MFISILALITALLISTVSAYFSVAGLVAIFAAAKIQIIILGSALEFAKVITTLLLHRNWKTLNWKLKSYLLPAVFVLMSITSMGIYGGLAKASIDQQLPTDNIATQLSVIDTQIQVANTDLTSAQQQIAQLDSVVNQLIGRSSDAKGAQHASNVRNSQKAERDKLNAEIAKDQHDLITLQQQRAPLATQQNNLTVQVGPVKYIAALVYGNSPTPDQLANTVRAVILIMVCVFDPLALVLLMAASGSLEFAKKNRKPKVQITEQKPTLPPEPTPTEDEMTLDSTKLLLDNALISIRKKNEEIEKLRKQVGTHENKIYEHTDTIESLKAQAAEMGMKCQTLESEKEQLAIMLEQAEKHYNIDLDNANEVIKNDRTTIAALYERVDFLSDELLDTQRKLNDFQASNTIMRSEINDLNTAEKLANRALSIDDFDEEIKIYPPSFIFGTSFPEKPNKDDIFVITSVDPNELYQWSGTNWTKLDKIFFQEYSNNTDYINYLTNQISLGICDFDKLLPHEQNAILTFLSTFS